MGRFNLEDKVNEKSIKEKIMIKDENRKNTMKMSETYDRKGDTVHNSSRASREGVEESLLKNSKTNCNHNNSELQSKDNF